MKLVSQEEETTDGYIELYCKVIARAVEDVTVKWGKGQDNGSSLKPSDLERKNSLLFLTSKSGEWAMSRNIICGIVGIDANLVRERTIKAIEKGLEFRISSFSSDFHTDGTSKNAETQSDFSE